MDAAGNPAPWTLILGENGTGKTTLLQCLALMQPYPAVEKDKDGMPTDSGQNAKAHWVEPDLLQKGDDDIERMLRRGANIHSSLTVSMIVAGNGSLRAKKSARTVEYGVYFTSHYGALKSVVPAQAEYNVPKPRPLVIGYGAARHVGHLNRTRIKDEDPTLSLFTDSTDLYDAEEILGDMDYANLDSKRRNRKELNRDEQNLNSILEAVADLLPNSRVQDIELKGPSLPWKKSTESGVHVRVDGTLVPLGQLSIGYQTMFAWTVDLAYRLLMRFSAFKKPMHGPAIVLIDEVDLHLHPRWQRDLRERLTRHFPNVQFVCTTHSPFTAQEALASGANLCVVRKQKGGNLILEDVIAPGEWRLDQVVTSDLFGLSSARSLTSEDRLQERIALLDKISLTTEENARLKQLDEFAATLPYADTPTEQEYYDDVKRVAARIEARSRRT